MSGNESPGAPAFLLIEIRPGVRVYRENVAEDTPAGDDAPPSYFCRPCLDAGIEAPLARRETSARIELVCPRCGAAFLERIKPMNGLAISPWG